MTLPKAEYVTFGFYFRSLVFFLFKGSLNITVLKLRGFFSVLAAIIQKHCDKLAMNYSFFRTYATTSPVVESDAVRCMDQTDIHVNALQESLKKVTLLSIKFIIFHIMISTDNNTDNTTNYYYYDIDNNIINNNSDLI